jgi:hypothetical protein
VAALIAQSLNAAGGGWTRVEDDQRQAGDAVLILPAHVGVLISPDRFVHVNETRARWSCVARLEAREWRSRRKSYWRYDASRRPAAETQICSAHGARMRTPRTALLAAPAAPLVQGSLIPEICPETVSVAAIIAPFGFERELTERPVGMTIAEMMRELGCRSGFQSKVAIGDQLVPPHLYERVKPKAGQCVTIRVTPGFVLAIPLIIAAAQAAAAAAATATAAGVATAAAIGVSTSTLAAIATSVVGLAGTLLMKALVPPPTPKPPKLSGSPAIYTISGDTNVLAPFSVFPRVYGVRLVTPQQAARPITRR